MTHLQAITLAILQGATELFPVSSLGHAVVAPALFGWHVDQHAPAFLPFLVMLHVGTATALLAYFSRDWWALIVGILGAGSSHQVSESRRVFALIVLATLPAVVIGFVLEHPLRRLFGNPAVAALFLIVNGGLLLAAERLRGRRANQSLRALSSLTARDALVIGFWQCLAFIPGISRSGATMVGGLMRGITHEGAAHFSFLIATPVIFGAAVLEVPKLLHAGVSHGMWATSVLGAVVAGVTAFASTAFLMRYFRGHEAWALNPFAYYCLAAGAGSLLLLLG
ncbi:MAG: undecaprenyl-diphosphate phosphatase [Rhodospirillales bacterium]|nr:undecaprenyl-diphosphate phosphatase [Rhodospirillales bacterium]